MPTTIKEYVSANEAAYEEIGKAVDSAVASHKGLSADVTFLKDTITKLQNNPGPISAEDQALLDAGVPRALAAAEKATAVATALDNLDKMTENPVEPPPDLPNDPSNPQASGRR